MYFLLLSDLEKELNCDSIEQQGNRIFFFLDTQLITQLLPKGKHNLNGSVRKTVPYIRNVSKPQNVPSVLSVQSVIVTPNDWSIYIQARHKLTLMQRLY